MCSTSKTTLISETTYYPWEGRSTKTSGAIDCASSSASASSASGQAASTAAT